MEGMKDTGLIINEVLMHPPQWGVEMLRMLFGYKCLIAIFDEDDLRVIVKWIKTNHPEIIRDVMCEDCPEVC